MGPYCGVITLWYELIELVGDDLRDLGNVAITMMIIIMIITTMWLSLWLWLEIMVLINVLKLCGDVVEFSNKLITMTNNC